MKRNKNTLGEFKDLNDLINYLSEEREDESFKKFSKEKDKEKTPHKLYDHLLKEKERLKKVTNFFENKVANKLEHPQTPQLLKIQQKKLEELKAELFLLTSPLDSTLNQNLAHLLHSAFNKDLNQKTN